MSGERAEAGDPWMEIHCPRQRDTVNEI